MNPDSYIIILTSNEPWGKVWYSKQHYANELSLLGHKVYFLNAPTKWKISHIFSFSTKEEVINKNLTIVKYKNNFPIRFFKHFFLKINDLINSFKIWKLIENKEPKVIWWQFDPVRFINIYFFKEIKRIYHVVDPNQNLFTDAIIAQKADLIICTNNALIKNYSPHNKHLIHIPHGIDISAFNLNKEKLKKVKENFTNSYILFIGTFSEDIDYELLTSVANKYHSEKLLLIGPLVNLSKSQSQKFKSLLKLKNVIYKEPIEANELKYYIANAKVNLIPYKIKSENKRSPLKLLNYIAQNKPIVTTLKHDFQNYEGKLIFTSTSEEDFINNIKYCIEHPIQLSDYDLQIFSEQRQYSKLIASIFNSIN